MKRTRDSSKRALDFVLADSDDTVLSKNKRKKLLRNPNKTFLAKPDKFEKCRCGNPKVGNHGEMTAFSQAGVVRCIFI